MRSRPRISGDNVGDDALLELAGIVGLAAFSFAADFEDVRYRVLFRRLRGPGFLGYEGRGGVDLRIEGDGEHTLAVIAGEVGGEIDGGGRLARAACHWAGEMTMAPDWAGSGLDGNGVMPAAAGAVRNLPA